MTGTFDDWSKSVKLEKKEGNVHEKLVELPRADEKIHYKVGWLSLCALSLCSVQVTPTLFLSLSAGSSAAANVPCIPGSRRSAPSSLAPTGNAQKCKPHDTCTSLLPSGHVSAAPSPQPG